MRKVMIGGLLCIALNTVAMADEKVILLGGGYKLEGSQGQIELNLKWVQQLLEQKRKAINVYYTDGNGENPDVFLQTPIEDSLENLQPLARIFGQHAVNSFSYRNHQVEGVLSETIASVLEPTLIDIFKKTNPDDSMLFVYNGHGSPSSSGAEKVALKLWGDTRLSAKQFHGLLDQFNEDADFRYIFTQCYSGGFHRVVYDDPAKGHKLAEGQRCGFTAESSWRQSEGCSASIDIGDYRDYTTFFFAAINGKDRLGQALAADPDHNADGITDMREAHMYTLEHAHSTDLSRSSSEDYLEQWQPWFLKWIPKDGTLPDNEYAGLARAVAINNELPEEDFVQSARKKGDDYRKAYTSLHGEKIALREKAESIRMVILNKATAKWPQLKTPYTFAYKQLLLEKINLVQNWILAQEGFNELRALQNKDPNLEKQLLDLERNIAQTEKILRFRQLAFLQDWLYKYGKEQDIKDYESLVSCESSPL